MQLRSVFGHFKTIFTHRWKVVFHCFRAGIGWQGLRHDLSKYAPVEFVAGVRYYQGGKRSPNEREREVLGYSAAWLHHKGRNRHHFEYWTDYAPGHRLIPVAMPMRYIIEMFCDRVAASKIYQKKAYTDASALNYYLRGKNTRMIHPETAEQIEALLHLLAEQGEKAAFAECRRLIKAEKENKH